MGNINLERRANQDSRNHGFFDDDIVQCLEKLTSKHFHKTIPYEENGKQFSYDVYKITCPNTSDDDVYLYIKLRVTSSNWLLIGSFKPA